MSGWLTVVVSVVASVIAAAVTARGTIRAACDQAINTELLRLRAGVVARRLRKFDADANALWSLAVDPARLVEATGSYAVTAARHTLLLSAHAIVHQDDAEVVLPTLVWFDRCCRRVIDTVRDDGTFDDSFPDAWDDFANAFHDMHLKVDYAAERRIVRSASYASLAIPPIPRSYLADMTG